MCNGNPSSLPVPFCFSFACVISSLAYLLFGSEIKEFQPQTVGTITQPFSMSGFSNTNTGDKPADPYKEKNIDEPSLSEKIEGLSTFTSTIKFGMLTTRIASSGLLTSRCMALAGQVGLHASSSILALLGTNRSVQEAGGVDLIFHTNTESGKTDDIESDPKVNVSFLTPTGEWASISGNAEVLTGRDLVHKYYSPALKAWLGDLGDGKHDGGPEDPRIGIIKVSTVTATYAISRKNIISRGIEMVQGAISGEAPAVNKLREITESEIGQCESIPWQLPVVKLIVVFA